MKGSLLMKKVCALLAATMTAASFYSQYAQAGDLYTSSPVFTAPVAPVSYPSGAYVGLGLGGTFDNQNIKALTSPFITDLTKTAGNTSFQGNVFGGYDYLWSPSSPAVIGAWVEGNLATGAMGLHPLIPIKPLSISAQGGFAAGGRLGYWISPIFMPYLVGGYTYSDYKTNTIGSNLSKLNGATAGFGVELALLQNIYLKAEYRHDWYNDTQLAKAGIDTAALRDTIDANKVLIGASYKFNVPVVPLSVKDTPPYKY
jgi:outer membrane immunogenic protein